MNATRSPGFRLTADRLLRGEQISSAAEELGERDGFRIYVVAYDHGDVDPGAGRCIRPFHRDHASGCTVIRFDNVAAR